MTIPDFDIHPTVRGNLVRGDVQVQLENANCRQLLGEGGHGGRVIFAKGAAGCEAEPGVDTLTVE